MGESFETFSWYTVLSPGGIASIALGIIVAVVYLHRFWVARDEPIVQKNDRIKALPAILGEVCLGGITLLLRNTFVAYVTASAFLAILVGIGCFSALCFLYGACKGSSGSRLALAIELLGDSFFYGWDPVKKKANENRESIHEKSKKSFAKLVAVSYDYMNQITRSSDPMEAFQEQFQGLASVVLYRFFQHEDDHPDYCVAYFTYDETEEELSFFTGASGKYYINKDTVLGKNSIAMKALINRKTLVWPGCGQRPDPPIERAKKFIVIPVFDPRHPNQYLGVLCVDSCKKGNWHFDDIFHKDVLKWLAKWTGKVHQCAKGEMQNA